MITENTQSTQVKTTPKYIKVREGVMKWVFILSSAFSIIALLSIFVFLLIRGLPAISEIGFFNFIFGTEWHPDVRAADPMYGIMPMILTTLLITLLSTALGVILGLGTAIFIFKFCHPKIARIVRQLVNLLAGIPSVIFGLFGLIIIEPALRFISPANVVTGQGILAAGIVLSIMVLPTIVAISLNALYAVPKHIYEGALALGATKERAIFRSVLPAAKSGVMAAIVLSVARAIGETMAVIMIIGGSPDMPRGLFQQLESMTAVIARNAGEASGLGFDALVGIGIVLFVFTLALNLVFMALKKRGLKRVAPLISRQKKSKSKIAQVRKKITAFFDKIKAAIAGFFAHFNRRNTSSKAVRTKYFIFKVISIVCAVLSVTALFGIVLFILIRGIPYLRLDFLFGNYTVDSPTLIPSLVGTLMIIGIAIAIAAPIGISTAIFLSEYASKSRFINYIRVAVETLAAVPSIVYGLFGLIVFVVIFGWGHSILGGGIVLSIMILPVIIRTTEESLLAVPSLYREGSLALGASKVRTTFSVVLPAAAGGVVSSLILAVGRIIAESAALILTIGMITYAIPDGIFSGGTSLALSIYYYGSFGDPGLAAATSVVLLALIMLLNLAASLIGRFIAKKRS